MTQPRRVLISAYACSPYCGSEPGVGWGFVSHLAKTYELDVIVEEEKFRTDIEHWIAKNPNHPAAQIRFHFISKKRNRVLRKIWPPSYYWYYRSWHIAAAHLARRLDQRRKFDLVHQLTMVGFREPGFLWQLNVPFVWGPVGGLGYFPWRFIYRMGAYSGAYYLAYNIYNWAQMRMLRRPKAAARKAGLGLVLATEETRSMAQCHWGCGGPVLSEVGAPSISATNLTGRAPGTPLDIVWSGQHIPRKALNLGLLALAQLPSDLDWVLDVIGSGKCTAKWQRLAQSLGVGDRCRFHGVVPRAEALSIMQKAHVMLITSLRDLTSTVTIEALALGLPIVCPDHCGFTDAVTEECGIRVPVTNQDDLTQGMADAIVLLGNDEELRGRLSAGAKTRALNYGWCHKAGVMAQIYRTKLGENPKGIDV